MERRFGSTAPFTTGAEEEFQLVDPRTRELVPAVEAVVGAAPEDSGRMGHELMILDRGTGTELQRAAYKRRGSLDDVVDYLLETTTSA